MEAATAEDVQKVAKLYTIGWIGFATYLGGPLAFTYLASKNFESLRKHDYAKNTVKYGIAFSLFLLSSSTLISEEIMNQIPSSAIPITYTSIGIYLLNKYQKEDVTKYVKNGGVKQSAWKVFGVVILSIVLSLLYVFALILLLPESMIS